MSIFPDESETTKQKSSLNALVGELSSDCLLVWFTNHIKEKEVDEFVRRGLLTLERAGISYEEACGMEMRDLLKIPNMGMKLIETLFEPILVKNPRRIVEIKRMISEGQRKGPR